jgi:aspartate racemase
MFHPFLRYLLKLYRFFIDCQANTLEDTQKMKTIGIIGGSTDIATVEYYNLINKHVREELGGLHTAEIIINSMDLANSAHYVNNELWDEGAEYLAAKAQSLARAGADFIICVSNTWHRVSDRFMAGIADTVPLLHIAEPTAEAIKSRGFKKVALLGTKATMSSPYLPDLFLKEYGIEIIVPEATEQELTDKVIFAELSYNQFTDESRNAYLEIIDNLASRGAEGVILGCTEIGLLVSQSDRPDIPMFDTLRLHAKAAAMKAVHG